MPTSSLLRPSGTLAAAAICALAAGVFGASPGSAAEPAAAPSVRPVDPPACSGTTRTSTLTLSASGEKETYWTHVSPDGSLRTDRWAQVRPETRIGAPRITVTTCRDASGQWRLHSYTAANQLLDLTSKATTDRRVALTPRTGAYGWGVFARGIKASTLTLDVARCVKSPQTADAHGVARGVAGVPLPGKRSYPVGTWIADTPLAPKGAAKGTSTCGDLGRVTVPLTVSASGAATLARPIRSVTDAQWVTGPVCPAGDSSCSENVREIVTVLGRP